ncbi:MFS multidrug transporter-like protein [Aulographum hederae CBS 113979]|uniref:MFS multidrug transporter-like protein n=1 Tax=Aulographum hederae CBS 113979 TaxID=1176131 RepID=A0A6G1GZ07_9PEZI|nr:MFS multidrug transporter-like protein [Aulographum hederae CBS 113979]
MADSSYGTFRENSSDSLSGTSNRTPKDASPDPDPELIMLFLPGDPHNPRNWPEWKKIFLIAPIVLIDLSVSWGASGFSPATADFAKDMHVSTEVATLGLSLYVLGLACGPMSLAPLSEYYGRSPIYIISYGVYLTFILGTALVENLGGFLVLRFLSGVFSSVTIANFGGTIADLYDSHKTGPAMSMFLWAATAGSPSGFTLLSFVAQTRPWRDVFWVLLGISGGFWVLMTAIILYCGETRHSVLLIRRAERERKITGNEHVEVPDEMKKRGVKQLFSVSLMRPFRFLATEAIVIFGALYNGYLYGLSFLFNGAFHLVFGPKGYGFDTLGVGLSFLGIFIGISIGPVTNLWQENYYQRRVQQSGGANIPEARVQMGKLAGIVFPLSLLFFALTTSPSISPVVPIVASALWGWSFYTLILTVATYTEDSYRVYSASALAGIGLVRNIAGAAFPLFGGYLFEDLGARWAGLLLAALAACMAPIPFVLDRRGRELRERSPWAREHLDDGERGGEESLREESEGLVQGIE